MFHGGGGLVYQQQHQIFAPSTNPAAAAGCSATYYSADVLRFPSATVANKFTCQCNRSYATKSALNYHRKWICLNTGHFRCDLCDYKAKRFYCFKEHLERRHSVKARSKYDYLKMNL